METLNEIFPVILCGLSIILVIVLIILVIKLIKTINKVNDVVDDVNDKVKSLDGLFLMVDKTTDVLSKLGDKFVDVITNGVSAVFALKKKKNGFFKFLAGIGIGAAAGVLFAPKAGSETRKELKAKLDEMLESLKDVDASDVRETIEAKITELKDAVVDLDKEKVIKVAKKKASQIKDMANELVDYAVKKGTPVLNEAAEAARSKAVEVTKEVLAKLEEKK